MKKVAKLTIAIITHRNDARFVASLESAQIAENIIVVDNNSNNDWENLKKDFDFKLVSHENKITNFAKIRNEVIKNIETEWVLFLDSDEILGLKSEIEDIINKDLFDGVSIVRRDVFLGKELLYGEAGNIDIIRMFKTNKGKFKRNVHEVAEINGRLGRSEIIVSHFSHTDISEFITTVATYSQMASVNEITSSETKIINIFKMIFFPPLKFIKNYIFKLGFLDGYRGLIYAIIMSFHSLFVRVFYFENQTKTNNEPEA